MSDNLGSREENSQKVHLLYKGQVQGVGFRWTFYTIAVRSGVKGFVRNLPDGSVEAGCEGNKYQIDSVISQVDEAMKHYIASCATKYSEAAGDLSDFSIAA